MKYLYLLIEKYKGEIKTPNLLNKIKHSTVSLEKIMNVAPENIIIANPEPSKEFVKWIQEKKYSTYTFKLSKNYKTTITWDRLNIFIEKAIQLIKFDEDVVYLDIDTEIIKDISPLLFHDTASLWEAEWNFTTARNLGNILPKLPFNKININYDTSFKMCNAGFVWIPSNKRKQLCEKVLWIVDTLNNGSYPESDRICNDLDEQIAFSIVLH